MKIAIVRLSAIGDLAQSLIIAYVIKKHLPYSEIHWYCDDSLKDIARECEFIDYVFALKLKELKKKPSLKALFKQIKSLRLSPRYDIVIDAQGLIKSAIVARMLGSKVYGFGKNGLREPIARFFYKHSLDLAYEKNVIERYASLAFFAIGLEFDLSVLPPPRLLSANTCPTIQNIDLIFILGASTKQKQYPPQKFAKIASDLGLRVLLVSSNENEDILAKQFKNIYNDAIIAPRYSLKELLGVLSSARLVVGGDTGPLHLACALHVPCVIVFGNTPHQRNAFVSSICKTVKSPSVVDPKRLDKNDFSIAQIKEKDIKERIDEILAR